VAISTRFSRVYQLELTPPSAEIAQSQFTDIAVVGPAMEAFGCELHDGSARRVVFVLQVMREAGSTF
jgi:hypothetical protein